MLAGSIAGGVGAYLFQVVGTRALGDDGYAPIAALWTIQYLMWSIVLHAVETYVDRAYVTDRGRSPNRPTTGASPWIWVVAASIAVAVAAWPFRERLFAGEAASVVAAGAIVAAYGGFAIVRGRLAGEGRYRAYGVISATESTLRLLVATFVAATIGTATALAWTLPVGAAAAAAAGAFLANGGQRAIPEPAPRAAARSDGAAGRFLAVTTVANAAVQLLLAGGPLVLVALGASAAEISVFFVTETAARVPVVVALSGGLSRILPAFILAIETSGRAEVTRLAWRVAAVTVAVAAAGGLLGAIVGPAVIRVFFGDGFAPPWWLAAVIGAGVLVATGGMVLNHLAIAAGAERRLPVAWWIGIAAATVTVVLARGSATARVTAGFAVGLSVAFTCLVVAMTRKLDDRHDLRDVAGRSD